MEKLKIGDVITAVDEKSPCYGENFTVVKTPGQWGNAVFVAIDHGIAVFDEPYTIVESSRNQTVIKGPNEKELRNRRDKLLRKALGFD